MGRFTTLAKLGFGELRRGNVSKPAEWVLSRTILEDRLGVVDSELSSPDWINADPTTIVDAQNGDYYLCLDAEARTVEIEPPAPSYAIDLFLTDSRPINQVKVDAEFELLDGENQEFTQTFRDGRFFDDDVLPLTVPVPGQRPAKRAEITVDVDTRSRMSKFERIVADRLPGDPYLKTDDNPLLSVPAPRIDGMPVFVISIDTFRYDFMDTFASTIDALGSDAVVPHEPRTQGTWTRPSHGVMLTGSHPGRNGLYGYMPGRGAISTHVETLAEMLSEHGYKCSAFTASPQLLPKDGFARGFHRYRRAPMEWKTRTNDAATVVDRTIEWIDRDRLGEHGRGFYFLHLLDSHFPYLPPLPISHPDIDLGVIDEFDTLEKQLKTYLEILDSESRELTTRQLNILLSFYRQTLEYVSDQLARLFVHLRERDILDDAFIIITGDHGEEFFERKFGRHESVHDANTRVGTVIKPPATASFTVPDRTDTVDIMPTIARCLDIPVPESCDGVPWQDGEKEDPRIVERFGPEYYLLSVEIDDTKGIFTYDLSDRERPSGAQIDEGPLRTQFFRIPDVRIGEYGDCGASLAEETRQDLRAAAENFLLNAPRVADGTVSQSGDVSAEVKDRLEELGYV